MSLIKKESIDKVFDSMDIVEILQDFMELKPKGSNFMAKSPFKEEKTPSFSVSKTKQIFKCFSTGKGGNAITFLIEAKNMSFVEAIQYVAEKYHIALEYEDDDQSEDRKEKQEQRKRLDKIMAAAVRKYASHFQSLPDTHPAKFEVYQKRMLTDDEVIQWQIGYCPKGSLVRQELLQNGLMEEGRKLSLISDNERSTSDFYQNRIIFPIQDSLGKYIGLAGRTLEQRPDVAKFFNPKDSDIYLKSKTWYGLNFAAKSIKKQGFVYMAEGYNDVIACHKFGVTNVISSCGTSITDDQIKILHRFTNAVVFLFDNDNDPANPGLKRSLDQIDAFVKKGFDVRICLLPPGQDPDSFTRKLYHTPQIGKRKKPVESFDSSGITYQRCY
jgi:DNA primase